MLILSQPHFHNEEAAYAYVEARLWPNGPVCPHCGGVERIGKMGGASTRIGAYKCYQCRKPFTVKVGTIFESSHVPMRHWLQVMFLMASSKKGVSANQVHRTLGCTLKTAWFVCHRVREIMREGDLSPFGSDGGAVEADEIFIGREPGVLSLVERNTGRKRSVVLDNMRVETIAQIVNDNVSHEARLMTDEASHYSLIGKGFADHGSVRHKADEYVSRDDPTVHTNAIEGSFSIFKRGMHGVYQHCGKRHLHRYLAEFDFRYTNRVRLGVGDVQRADIMLADVVGKRLTYRTTAREA